MLGLQSLGEVKQAKNVVRFLKLFEHIMITATMSSIS